MNILNQKKDTVVNFGGGSRLSLHPNSVVIGEPFISDKPGKFTSHSYSIGVYDNKEEASQVHNSLLEALKKGDPYFEMPQEGFLGKSETEGPSIRGF